MDIFGKTKGTELEHQIAQLATGEAVGGAMYYALAMIAKEKFKLDDVAREFIELGNQETNHGAFYSMLNGRYPFDEKSFWQLVKGLSKAEYKGENNINALADKLLNMGLSEASAQVREFALQEKHHGEVTNAIIEKYAPKDKEENLEENSKYVCKVCGFEYIGNLDKEPADYKCPICNMPKTAFELQH